MSHMCAQEQALHAAEGLKTHICSFTSQVVKGLRLLIGVKNSRQKPAWKVCVPVSLIVKTAFPYCVHSHLEGCE